MFKMMQLKFSTNHLNTMDAFWLVVATIVVIYILLCAYAIKNPPKYVKLKSPAFKARIIAHRGGAGEHVENTLSAMLLAVEKKVDMLELDVHITKDEQVVVCHDDHLLRVAGVDSYISKLNYNELPFLKNNIPLDEHSEVAGGSTQNPMDRRIPLLEEVLKQTYPIPVNIDIKINNDKLIEKTAEIVSTSKRENSVAWGNFDEKIVRKLHKANQNVDLICSTRTVLKIIFLFYIGLLPFIPLKENFLELPVLTTLYKLLLNPLLFKHLKKRGMQIFLWVLNTPEEFEHAFRVGTDGIITDYPTLLSDFIKNGDNLSKNLIMSLAEELLADLEEGEDDDYNVVEEAAQVEEKETRAKGIYNRVTAVAHLLHSDHFQGIMQRITDRIENSHLTTISGPVESHPEYLLIVDANGLAAEIDNEIAVVHKFVRDKYAKRFPELESLVPMPMEYVACVKELGNDILDKAKHNEQLQNILLPSTVIVISVTASTTQGECLTDEELAVVMEGCEMAIQLNDAKLKIYQFVESRMHCIAPNLSVILGPEIAAKLMGTAGGITQLSKIPACNVLILGSQKRMLSGFSSTTILPHTGYIYYTPLVQSLPADLRRKAARLVAAKCTLAARIDSVHSHSDGSAGLKLAEEVRSKFEKWQEPPPKKLIKPLSKPLDQASKKRGGRRIRKMKERLGLTELRRKANRMNFGQIEEDILQEHMGFSLGQAKSGGPGGRLRTPQVDQKSRARMSKTLQRNMQKQQSAFGSVTSVRRQLAGTISTVTFTPVQGLEIVNPQAAEKDKSAESTNAKYFREDAEFIKVETPIPGHHNNQSK
ncbi:U4/U6 small nuclear ribonucleoprotein Prp31 [Trichinella pseudospiralis]|uniref:U4/U6 small nuclear ribonucleoprotein Prp31 n=1 Tax=Trichinella pseudospiralis TaxID=6337 RepID=A0A0V1KEQ9_TRIPS|nr:U4/U6 small nuclear ribonucleoprotein Prp31 [Trichinella pseudospiralis]